MAVARRAFLLLAGGVAVSVARVFRRRREAAPSAPLTEKQAQLLRGNESLFTGKELELLLLLLDEGQAHLVDAWPPLGTDDEAKRRLVRQLVALDAGYIGGLQAYLRNARRLLEQSRLGDNPFDGYTPEVPEGTTISILSKTDRLDHFEALGMQAVQHTAFVLVAGGLGERLGYSGIKVALPVECATGISMLGHYIASILALQRKSRAPQPIQLAIMTSDDTHQHTVELLRRHGHFGARASQVHLMKQEKVACLADGEAHLALDPADPYALQTKPHGHGDVHALLHRLGLARRWHAAGVKWVAFFQDTNALVFRGLLASLGVSQESEYDVNSLCVPRKAKEAIGAIARLKHRDGSSMTVNVEYNQLDPLLRATSNPLGDVDDASGLSPFPGNINQIVLKLDSYVAQLAATGGVIGEFVNPKYADASRTTFKKTTRLECMMQDYPKSLPSSARVGFTTIAEVWAAYSPVKNSVAEALAKQQANSPTHSATAGELDMYAANCRLLTRAGVAIQNAYPVTFNGLHMDLAPRVVLSPDFMSAVAELKVKILNPSGTKISNRSSLVILGDSVTINTLDLDGSLVLRVPLGSSLTIDHLTVRNQGWAWVPLQEGEQKPEELQMRGFHVLKEHGCMIDVLSGDSQVVDRQLDGDMLLKLRGKHEQQAGWSTPVLSH